MKHGLMLALLCGVVVLVSDKARSDDHGMHADEYKASVLAWRAARDEGLRGEYGWLRLAGLYWLQEGSSTLGSDEGNRIVLPGRVARRLGRVRLDQDRVFLTTSAGADVTVPNAPDLNTRREFELFSDANEAPTDLRHRNFAFRLIDRNREFALRVWDLEHPGIESWPGVDYYAIDPSLRLSARFDAYAEPRQLRIGTVVDGLDYRPLSPGELHFEIDGKPYSFEVYEAGDTFFIIFADATSRSETYPAGRFVYTDLPDAGGQTVLDFNKAYNPPCVFNEFATCPVAAARNRLTLAIEAGEKYSPDLYVGYAD